MADTSPDEATPDIAKSDEDQVPQIMTTPPTSTIARSASGMPMGAPRHIPRTTEFDPQADGQGVPKRSSKPIEAAIQIAATDTSTC